MNGIMVIVMIAFGHDHVCSLLCYVWLCYALLCYALLCYVLLCYVLVCYVLSLKIFMKRISLAYVLTNLNI